MKRKCYFYAAIFLSLLFSNAVIAEVTANVKAPPDSWNGPEQRQLPGQSPEKMITMNQENQFRCWQRGNLIIQADNLRPINGSDGELMIKGSNKLHAYDFGETFCLYLGGQSNE